MKLLYFTIVLLVGISACNQKANEPAKTEEQPVTAESKTIGIKLAEFADPKKDLRCGMPLVEGEIADTATYEGKLYGFCAPECKADFLKDPQAYLTQK